MLSSAKVKKTNKPVKALTKAERFLRRCRMHWVKIADVSNTNERTAVVCGLTKLNGAKCLMLGDEWTIEYVAIRNIVAIGPRVDFDKPHEGVKSKCKQAKCTRCGYVPSQWKAFKLA